MNIDKNQSSMDVASVFKLLKHLSCQSNIKDLTLALTELVITNFPGAQVTVYEIHGGRGANSLRTCLTGLDCLHLKAPLYFDDCPLANNAYDTKSATSKRDQNETTQAIPVELYDTSISHMVIVKHRLSDGEKLDLFDGILQTFVDIFRNLCEKSYDPLTRILNRQALDQLITSLAYAKRKEAEKIAVDGDFNIVAIMDIDHFKKINDRFGHALGDETLVLFAQTIRSVLRQEDMFFRYGGEEFVIFIKATNTESAEKILERCRKVISEKRFPQVESVTISVGFSQLEVTEHPSDSISKADKALYYAKKNGRNQVHSYHELVKSKLISAIDIKEPKVDFWE